MKSVYKSSNGKFEVTEEAGKFTISVDGTPVDTVDAGGLLKLGEAALNAALPESVRPLALVVEGIANQAIAALE